MTRSILILAVTSGLVALGCQKTPTPAAAGALPAEVVAERGKLSAEDQALVEAQQWCVVNTDELLGSMGPPLKLTIKGQPVFICCGGCKKKAESDPDKTLAKLEELKVKAKAEKDKR